MATLSDEDIEARLAALPGWEREGNAIKKTLKFEDFVGSVEFVNRITPVAEELKHHPDLSISWNTVVVSLSTHSQGGITENDFDLATRVDALA